MTIMIFLSYALLTRIRIKFKRLNHHRNTKIAFRHYYMLAQKYGNSTAQRWVGLMYATGIGVERNYAKVN